MQARLVLADCRVALERAELAVDPAAFRVSWAALVALLRAVGHVLDKVDGRQSESLRRAIDARWRLWHADRAGNRAYWSFIESERNNVLTVYDLGYKPDDMEAEEAHADGTRVIHAEVPFLGQLRAGPFAGQLNVARKALAWWTAELNAIEAAAREPGP
jgi:hypothetical protein